MKVDEKELLFGEIEEFLRHGRRRSIQEPGGKGGRRGTSGSRGVRRGDSVPATEEGEMDPVLAVGTAATSLCLATATMIEAEAVAFWGLLLGGLGDR